MNIEWTKVTWYSKFTAMALFVALPFVGFWLGIRYDSMRGPLQFSPQTPDGTQTSTTTNTIGQLTVERPKTIVAGRLVMVDANKEFTFKNMSGVVFRVKSVSRASGALPIAICGSSGKFIYIPNLNDTAATGTCIEERSLTVNNQSFDLAVVDLEVINQSNSYVNSRFLQIFYNPETGSDIESKLAESNPVLSGYGALPFSSRRTTVSFLVPKNQEQIQLVYGDYGKSTGLSESQETLLGKSVSAWIINFTQKTISDLPG